MAESASPRAGHRLLRLFQETESRRRETENRWLRDLRQYKGVYDPEVAARLHPGRSRAFLRLTRAKIRSVDARLMDLLFPGAGQAAWSIEPTPIPEAAPALQRALAEEFSRQSGTEPTSLQMEEMVSEASGRACRRMQRLMRDQLAEMRYREVLREVIHSGNLFGAGVLKGPLVERRNRQGWDLSDQGWRLREESVLRPFIEFVPLWDFYPDMEARDIQSARHVFQRHVLSRSELVELARRPDFDGESILAHLEDHPHGSGASFKLHETELRDLAGTLSGSRGSEGDRFEILEFWGLLPAGELAELAGDGAHDAETTPGEIPATVWLLGDRVVKAAAAPLEGLNNPYFLYHFDRDETTLFGEGLASIMRDPQQLFNASVRALLDNAAISAGPQLEINQDLLPEGEDVTDIHPFRIWLRSGGGAEAQHPAVRVSTLPTYADQFMAMAQMFERYAHETTGVPSSLHTEFDAAARTATGLSMLLGAASAALKDQVRHFDDGITRPFLTALYHWNMQFSQDVSVKGDFRVVARGWSSLVSRELQVRQLDDFAQSTANPLDAPYVNRAELLRRRALARELDESVILDEAAVRRDVSGETS